MTLVERVRSAGVVGAGGAGFPTHVKIDSRAEWLLANGAECEPLLHKDRELMIHFAEEIVDGMRLVAQAMGAARVAVGIKSKNRRALDAMESPCADAGFSIAEFGDFYPSGDEYEVVYEVTGRLIPPGGIPLDIGAVVQNVETLCQVSRAHRGRPVTETFLTISGAVRRPMTRWVPVGTSVADLLELAGGALPSDFAVMESGLMMGRLIRDLHQPVTKTTAGLIVLPREHALMRRYDRSREAQNRIGKSACDQCTYCTELCPRYLLGYDIQPHLVMRSLAFTSTGSEIWNRSALLCCACGICTLYACPESLYPREACLQGIADLKAAGRGRPEERQELRAHPMKEYRRLPMSLLMQRLGVDGYESEAPFVAEPFRPLRVRIPLKQHMGEAARPLVSKGDRVRIGDRLGGVEEERLGAHVHASIAGRVNRVGDWVEIEGEDA